MFLPIGDHPNPKGVASINLALIAANVAVFVLVTLPLSVRPVDLNDPLLIDYLHALGVTGAVSARDIYEGVSAYDLFVFKHGFRPAEPSLQSLFSAMFLHGGWMHLIGNMLFLYIFGDNVEHRLGRIGYLLTYLGTGIAATLFFALFVPGSQTPLVGASGAISGVLGCYFIWFSRNNVKTFVFLFPFIMGTYFIPARLVLGFYLIVDNLFPFLFTGGGSGGGVAHGAHIGGFLGGVAVAVALNHNLFGEATQKVRRPKPSTSENGTLWPYAASSTREGRLAVASEDVLAAGERMLQRGAYDEALSLFRRFIADRPSDPYLDRAHLGAGTALLHKPRCSTSAYHYFLAASDLARSDEVLQQAKAALRRIERLGPTGGGDC